MRPVSLTPERPTFLLVSEDSEWLLAGQRAFCAGEGETYCTRNPTPAGLSQCSHYSVIVMGFKSLASHEFRATLRTIQGYAPGLPILLSTTLSVDNLKNLKDVVVTDIVSMPPIWEQLHQRAHQLTQHIDFCEFVAAIRNSQIKHTVSIALVHALTADKPIGTVGSLARAITIPVSTLRRAYTVIAEKSDIALPDLLHAIKLRYAVPYRARGASVDAACRLSGMDPRTAARVVARLGPEHLGAVISGPVIYRQWLQRLVARVVRAGVTEEASSSAGPGF